MILDHLVISATDLASGRAAIEAALGLPLAPGGEHADFGTHNLLLSLGPEDYLEVIAINPNAPGPDRPRWYNLDNFAGAPRLTNWACRAQSLTGLDPAIGLPLDIQRGAYSWTMAVPETGILPYDDMHPALLSWKSAHPAPALPDHGARLAQLTISHPEAPALEAAVAMPDPRVIYRTGPIGLSAQIDTPNGRRVLE